MRDVSWEVTGAPNHLIVQETEEIPATFSSDVKATYKLQNPAAGDTITITITVGPADTYLACDDDKSGDPNFHTGDHSAPETATCTIKLWRMDLDVTGGDADQDVIYPFLYDTTFAETITTKGVLVGATPAATDPWEWTSTVDYSILNTMSGSNTWSGIIVANSTITTIATVENGCEPSSTTDKEKSVIVQPTKRRPGWEMSVNHAGVDNSWHQGDPNWFPGHGDAKALAQNTNSEIDYVPYNVILVTPVYSDPNEFNDDPNSSLYLPNFHPDPSAFYDVVDDVPDGPNLGLWYNSDPSIYRVARQSLINYWITPAAVAPATPALDPSGNSYQNWLSVQGTHLGDYCTCTNPAGHGGTTSDIRYVANVWHEGYGAPSSPNQVKLGHQAQIEDGVDNGAKSDFDAVWLADLRYADTDDQLRAIDEGIRKQVQEKLYAKAISVHNFINPPWDEHNFNGQHYHYNFVTNQWFAWSPVFSGCY